MFSVQSLLRRKELIRQVERNITPRLYFGKTRLKGFCNLCPGVVVTINNLCLFTLIFQDESFSTSSKVQTIGEYVVE